MANDQIKRSISLSVTGGNVVLEEFQVVGRGAESELGRVDAAAAKNSKSLEDTAGATEGMSRRGRAAFANFGNQVQDVAVQVQGGTDAFRALSQQVPQALDAFAFWMPSLTLVGAGVAILLPIVGSLIERLLNTSAAQKAATEDALQHKQALDALASSFGISAENAAKYQAGLKALSDQQKDLLNVDLRSTIEADQKALDAQASAMRSSVRSLTSAADVPDQPSPVPGQPDIPLRVSDPDLANLRDYAKTTRDLFDAYDQGKASFTDVTDALERLSIMTGESDATRAKEIDGLKTEVEAHEAAQRAVDVHKAQYHLLLQELGETNAFTEADRTILNHTAAIQGATEALVKYGTANRMNLIEETSNIIAKADPQAAEQYRTEQINALHQLQKTLQDDANRNLIVLKTGLDSGEAERLRSSLESDARKVGETLQDEIKNIRAAGEAMIQGGSDSKATQAAVNQLIQEAIDKRQQVADKAKKEREEQELINAGLAKNKEQADALLSSTTDRYAGLQGIAKIEAEIADKRRAEQVLSGPGEAAHRAELEQQINQLVDQRNALLQTQQEKLAAIDKSNKDVLDSLDAALAKSASKEITQADIDAAGLVARDRIKFPSPEQIDQPGGAQQFDRSAKEADLAQYKAEAAQYDKFFTDADADIEKQDEKMAAVREKAIGITDRLISPQERYNDEVAKLSPLLDGNVEDQIRYNMAVDELNRRLPILQREYEIRLKRQQIEELEQSNSPVDWASAGFKSIQTEADDTGREVSGAFKSGFDSINHGFFEMVSGQKQGWADVKQAALSFVDTLGEVAMKQFEIMLINQTIGLVGSAFASSYSAPAAGNYGAVMQSGDIMASYGHTGIRAGEPGRAAYLPAALFAAAERYHRGGRIEPHERPIIVQVGEEVLTERDSREWQAYKHEQATRFHGGGVITADLPTWTFRGGGIDAGDVPMWAEHAPRFHGGGIVGPDDRIPTSPMRTPTSAPARPGDTYAPVMIKQEVHNTYSGVYDMDTLRTVTDMSAAKAHAQLARAFRSDPNLRRQVGRS